MPEGIIKLTESQLIEAGKPIDFSFKHLTTLEGLTVDGPRSQRIGHVPQRSVSTRRYFTRSVWLNNNKLPNFRHLDALVNNALENPSKLGWLDVSFNFITEVDDCLLKFPNLRIIYLHGNVLKSLDEVLKLRPLKQLKTVTFHGNPICEIPKYRYHVMTYLPQVENLDFSTITALERFYPKPPEAVRKAADADSKRR